MWFDIETSKVFVELNYLADEDLPNEKWNTQPGTNLGPLASAASAQTTTEPQLTHHQL